MELSDFLRETQTAVRSQMNEGALYEELVFSGIVMEHMADIGMTSEPVECHYEGKVGNANLRLSGYALSEEADQLDLFVSLYAGVDVPTPVPDVDTKTAAEQCLRFLTSCAEGKMASKLDPSSDVRSLAETLQAIYNELEQVRIYVITDRVAKSKNFKTREIGGKSVRLEVMDIERLHRHWSEGKPRDELVVDFSEVSGQSLPCVFVPGENDDYDYALTAVPGEALRFLYEKFGARLLEANVRSFLSVNRQKVISGIRERLKFAGFSDRPEHCLVIGGPPCQAYSVVGRSRNRGKTGYKAEDDHRHFLYKEYLNVLKEFQPLVFVMENVKGILTAQVEGNGIIEAVMADLRNPGKALGGAPSEIRREKPSRQRSFMAGSRIVRACPSLPTMSHAATGPMIWFATCSFPCTAVSTKALACETSRAACSHSTRTSTLMIQTLQSSRIASGCKWHRSPRQPSPVTSRRTGITSFTTTLNSAAA